MDAQITEGLRSSHTSLVTRLRDFSAADAQEPSLLAGWTRGMLVAHINSAGSAVMRCVEAAGAGKTIEMYTGGDLQRDTEIEAGRHAPAPSLVDDLIAVCRQLDDALAGLSEPAWEMPMLSRRGPIPMRVVVVQRWIDVEAHHVDLGLGYSPEEWPRDFVDLALPATVQVFPALRNRPDANRAIRGTWRIVREDGPGDWSLQTENETDGSVESPQLKCEIRGSGAGLLALLLGRTPSEPPTVLGDAELAKALKSAFPGP